MALSDDARVIVGSANFNQRSLDGCRDTEAGIAASQVSTFLNQSGALATSFRLFLGRITNVHDLPIDKNIFFFYYSIETSLKELKYRPLSVTSDYLSMCYQIRYPSRLSSPFITVSN